MVIACSFAPVCSPDYPGHPFGSLWLSVFDCARVLCVLIALVTLAAQPAALARVTQPGQRARLAALSLLSVQAIVTELEHLGDDASLRLVINLAAVLLALYGTLALHHETPAAALPPERE
jgi:hypothetical protein